MAKYGVVSGVATFAPGEQFRPLPFARNDAIRLYQVLVQHCDFKLENLTLLVDESDDLKIPVTPPTRSNLISCVNKIAREAGPDDEILLFFAGHGAEISQRPYLITQDTKQDVLKQTAVDVSELNGLLHESKARVVLRIFDACRTPFAAARALDGRMTSVLNSAIFEKAKGWATLSACSSGECAYDMHEREQGLFTYYLCEGLSGKAKSETGVVTFDGLVDYVKTSVANYASLQSLEQTPHAQSDVSGVWTLGAFAELLKNEPVKSGSPLASLEFGLHDYLASQPLDARQLQFTTQEQTIELAKKVASITKGEASQFTSGSLKIGQSDGIGRLNEVDGSAYQALQESMRETDVIKEHRNETRAYVITLRGQEAVVPTSLLIVCIVRFTFFHWIWCNHRLDMGENELGFKSTQKTAKWFYTVTERGRTSDDKLQTAINDLFARVSETQLAWTRELNEHVNSRLESLRKAKSLID